MTTLKNDSSPMRAIVLGSDLGPDGLAEHELAVPTAGPGEALVRVLAAAITRDELTWPVDRLPAIPSYEVSGVIARVGPDVRDVEVGDPVYALTPFDRDGAAAEFAVVSADLLAPKPSTLDNIESAALPMAALTAWQGLFVHGGLEAGQRVLIHGATGGVGGVAVQLARGRGAHVIGTVSTANVEAANRLGLDQVVDHTKERFEDVVDQVDLVFDTAGGDRLEHSPEVVRLGGKLVSIAEEPPQEQAASRGIGTSYFVVEPDGAQLREITAMVEEGRLRPTIDAVFPLADAGAAFERAQGVHPSGKIVLHVADEYGGDVDAGREV
jgi:NADPH:quinone reductase-like Zn-dependent oxidoreductase